MNSSSSYKRYSDALECGLDDQVPSSIKRLQVTCGLRDFFIICKNITANHYLAGELQHLYFICM